MPPSSFCCTCARDLSDWEAAIDAKTEKPVRDRNLLCCGRLICANCIYSNPRFAEYCPFCQKVRLPRNATSEQQKASAPQQPPPYTPFEGENLERDGTQSSSLLREEQPSRQPSRSPPPSYAAIQPSPPATSQTLASSPSPSSSPSSSSSSASSARSTTQQQDVTHHLSADDTLLSLSLLYRVPLPILRSHNRLHTDSLLAARRTLLIPASHYRGPSLSPHPLEDEAALQRKAALRRFMVRCKCADYKVATLYLEGAAWDLEEAVEKWRGDERWEAEHPFEERTASASAAGGAGSAAALAASKMRRGMRTRIPAGMI